MLERRHPIQHQLFEVSTRYSEKLMASVRSNILANLAGRGWTALILLRVRSRVHRFRWNRGYGLSCSSSRCSHLQCADVVLSATLSRELARTGRRHAQGDDVRDLVRSFEFVYWVLACYRRLGCSPFGPVHPVASAVSLDQATLVTPLWRDWS